MSYWPAGLTRHRTRQSKLAQAHTVSSTSIIAVGAVLTTFVILGTIALHRGDPSVGTNQWSTPLPTMQLEQPAMPVPVPVLPAPTSSAPAAVPLAPAGLPGSPTQRKPQPVDPARTPGLPPALAPVPAPAPLIPAAGSRISLVAADDTGLRLRHRKFRLRLDRISRNSSESARSDANFVVRAGLADRSCVSLESVNYPGRFVRHQNFDLVLHEREETGLFTADATFCAQRVGSTGDFVLWAVNYPERYVTVRDSALRISRVPSGDAQRFRTAAAL